MTPTDAGTSPEFAELIKRYDKWRRISVYAGLVAPDEPAQEGDRLYFRYGFPYDGWTGRVVEPHETGYNVLSVTSERRIEPAEYFEAYFSRFEDAGKYILWNIGESVRMHYGLTPITQVWRAEGLDPKVEKVVITEKVARYSLKADPQVYFEAFAGGIKPENHLLTITYDELDTILLDGIPQAVLAQI